MITKSISALAATALFLAVGCSSVKENAPANSGKSAQVISSDGDNSQKTVTVSSGNSSVEVKQFGSDGSGETQIRNDKENVVEIKKSKVKSEDEASDDDVSEVSDGTGNDVKSTIKNGKRTTTVTDGKGNVVETRQRGDSKNGVITDGKGNKVTVGPGGVVIRDAKGNKVVVPNF